MTFSLTRVVLLAMMTSLASCGGGGGGSTTTGGGHPTVTTLSASNLSYGKTMVVSVSGQSLDQGLVMSTDNVCTSVTELPGGSEAAKNFTCRVGSIGEYNVTLRDSAGKFLASVRVNVPQPQVTLTTTKGTIVIELNLRLAPLSVDNFLRYVNDSPSFYLNALFHRVEKDFVIQAGGYSRGLVAKNAVHEPIALESQNGLSNLRGTIGMAREFQNSTTATSQFYFNLKDNPELDYKAPDQPGYAVFGKIITGLDVIDSIGIVPVRFDLTAGLSNVPVTEVVITASSQTK